MSVKVRMKSTVRCPMKQNGEHVVLWDKLTGCERNDADDDVLRISSSAPSNFWVRDCCDMF